MISIYKIKPKFQAMLMPLLKLMHRMGISANQITIASALLSAVIGILFWFHDYYRIFLFALPIGLLMRMALNALDGMMARIYNQQSNLGEVLNELLDIVSDLFIFFPLIKFHHDNLFSIVIFICLTIVNEFCGILAKAVSGERRYDGPMGKSDRAFVIAIYGICMYFGLVTSSVSFWLFNLLILLILVSSYLRLRRAL